MQRITPVVLNLLIINFLVFFAQQVFGGATNGDMISDLFALHYYKSSLFKPHQVITYMFLHGNFTHIFFNMFGLWMFGSHLENYLGSKKFLILYFLAGIGAGLTQLGSYSFQFAEIDRYIKFHQEEAGQYQELLKNVVTVGASGGIMGILAAFGYLFPNIEMMIIPIPIPIKAKWAIGAMIVLDIFGGIVKVPGDQIAHFAHIGGALIGFFTVFYWNKTNRKTFY